MAGIDKEQEFFYLATFGNSDLYIRYRRFSEFESALSLANKNFTDQVNANILSHDSATQLSYLGRLEKKFNEIDLSDYAEYSCVISFLHKHNLGWRELDAFYRTMHDFYLLDINGAGVIGYYNKEPEIPTDYDTPEMSFLKKE